jgi:hypothetical protein
MWSRRQTALSAFLILLGLAVLFGCRAFEPEVVIVNNPPDTYLVGAPAETSGGYYHFHVYWYGTDSDGSVERFVWALTDTTIQDYDTDDDEEDSRFNPALNISTLEIGHWTTRTDSIFDFQLNQGPVLAYNMTFHMVAVDDRGDFDRSPARLQFISNALGNPKVDFLKKPPGQGEWAPFANNDTIAYGEPFSISWFGHTDNIRSYQLRLLAERDTVPDYRDSLDLWTPAELEARSHYFDGLLGYKFRLPEVACDESQEDCWNPRQYDDARGDSVSFFGPVRQLTFSNDNSNSSIYGKRLVSGVHRLLVNTIDVAGVQIPPNKQELDIVVNYDPDTFLLRNQSDPFYDDPAVYPYYLVFNRGGAVDQYNFAENDTVPDRAYVVFKALGRDDPRDLKIDANYHVTFQGLFNAIGLYNRVAPFRFKTEVGDPHRTPEWDPAGPDGWSADTLGYLVGPFEYKFKMRSVDEHGKRDLTPDSLRFFGNFPPCVQCVELLNWNETSSFTYEDDCWDQECAARVDTIYASQAPNPFYHLARNFGFGYIYIKLATSEVWPQRPVQLADVDSIPGNYFGYRLFLHGKDHPQEPWLKPEDRVMSWSYEVVYDVGDPGNLIRDGAGSDNILFPTRQFSTVSAEDPIYVDENGVWIFSFRFFVPLVLHAGGPEAFWNSLFALYGNTQDADLAFHLTTIQLGPTTARVRARDVSNCDYRPDNAEYRYYRGARPPRIPNQGIVPNLHRKCDASYTGQLGVLALDDFGFESSIFTKKYQVKVLLANGTIYP